MSKPKNFTEGQLVTWRKENPSSWTRLLSEKFGDGPFKVVHTDYGMYDTPKVAVGDPKMNTLLFYGEERESLLLSSWLEEYVPDDPSAAAQASQD